jgi:hypothetical protein
MRGIASSWSPFSGGWLASGLEYSTPINNVWTFDGERVIRMQMFITWEEALEAAGLRE